MTIDEMREKKREYGYTSETISRLSGVPLGTVQKIFSGETSNPRRKTIQKLTRVLSAEDHAYVYAMDGAKESSYIRETEPAYGAEKQGQYTLDDYYRWPKEQRVELIDGCIYDMGAPFNYHQLVIGDIFYQIASYIKNKKGPCAVLLSPIDVQLNMDDKTMVQPDISIVCDRTRLIKRCIYGAPDFIIEVISPSSTKRDQVIKLDKYMKAGVREYWIVDYRSRQVFVYFFESEELVRMYPLGSPVPVNIYDGDLVIDFTEVRGYIDEYAPEK